MSLAETIYMLGVHAARPAVGIAAPFSTKLRQGLQGRRGASHRLLEWAKGHRNEKRPLVWVHAPSVGESLMAQAIIGELRAMRPDLQVVFTYFSPSAERVAQKVGADIADYMPWDTARLMDDLLDALKPSVIAFVRTEIWPTLVRRAAARSIKLALVNAALSSKSSRLRTTSRWLLSPAYALLDRVGAIGITDGERFPRLGVPAERVRITGDARFDQVFARVRALDRDQPLLRRLRDDKRVTIVAGSTWSSDEEEILPAFATARKGWPLRLLIAPHEPEPAHLQALAERLDSLKLKHGLLSQVEAGSEPLPEVIIIDRVGVLADLYSVATIAYVGGGFHGAGLHSVIEPAGLGVPVIFGPRHGNAREADELAGTGGGFVLSDGSAFASIVLELADRLIHRRTASEAARAYVSSKLGGARRNAELISSLL